MIQVIPGIYLTDAHPHQQFISSIVLSYNGVPRNNLKPQEEVPMHKQEQCTQECWIKIGSETSVDQLDTPYNLHQNYTSITKQQLKESWRIKSLPKKDLSES